MMQAEGCSYRILLTSYAKCIYQPDSDGVTMRQLSQWCDELFDHSHGGPWQIHTGLRCNDIRQLGHILSTASRLGAHMAF